MNQRRRTLVEPVEALGTPAAGVPYAGAPPPAPTPLPPVPAPVPPAASADTPQGTGTRRRPAAAPLGDAAPPAGDPGARTSPTPAAAAPDCEVYRPSNRPGMALLLILDDGSAKNGEHVRIRSDRTMIGREVGDIIIPHDRLMSGRHAELVRELDRDRYRWFLSDSGSTNGTFVRVFKSPLKHNQELILGSKRYRYQQGQHAGAAGEVSQDVGPAQRKATMTWQAVSPEDIKRTYPSLVELLPSGEEGRSLSITHDEMKIGADPAACTLVIQDDPFVSRMHAILVRSPTGQWLIQDNNSTNGLWMRVKNLPIDSKCEFQLGEQRFVFYPL